MEVERVIRNLNEFENLEEEDQVQTNITEENGTPIASPSLKLDEKSEQLATLKAKNARSVKKSNQRIWDTTDFMNKLTSYVMTVENNSRTINLSLKQQSFRTTSTRNQFAKKGKMDYLYNRSDLSVLNQSSRLGSGAKVDRITPIFSKSEIANNNTGPFLHNFNLSKKLY